MFPLFLGVLTLSLGAGGLLFAALHPAPTATAFAKFVSWPRKAIDRTDIVLKSIFLGAIGCTLLFNVKDGSSTALLAAASIVLAAGIAIGVRRPAV